MKQVVIFLSGMLLAVLLCAPVKTTRVFVKIKDVERTTLDGEQYNVSLVYDPHTYYMYKLYVGEDGDTVAVAYYGEDKSFAPSYDNIRAVPSRHSGEEPMKYVEED